MNISRFLNLGDSGGPLQVFSYNKEPQDQYHLIGITSAGPGCGYGFPGLYTRILTPDRRYIKWIEDIVFPENFAENPPICKEHKISNEQ